MAELIRVNGPRTTCAFDNLRHNMREVYYRLLAAGVTPTHWVAGREPLQAYELLSEQNDPPITTFKGLPGTLAPEPDMEDRLRFLRHGEVVGEIVRIS